MVTVVCEDIFYILQHDPDAYARAVAEGSVTDDGVEDSFTVLQDFNEE